MSLVNFMESLALSHGKAKSVYSARRPEQDWKKLFGQLSARLAEETNDEL